jgi:hypothetical protein
MGLQLATFEDRIAGISVFYEFVMKTSNTYKKYRSLEFIQRICFKIRDQSATLIRNAVVCMHVF